MSKVRTCRVCGCTDDRACDVGFGEGCHWLDARDDLCSACVAAQTHVIKTTIEHVNASRSFSIATCSCGGFRNRVQRMGQDYPRRQGLAVRKHWQAVVQQ